MPRFSRGARGLTWRQNGFVDDVETIRAELLSAAVEDLTGVYEAWWTANTLRPHLAVSARLALAEAALASLLADGLVVLRRGSWTRQVDVAERDVDCVLREYSTWTTDDEADRVFFEATPSGRLAYGLPE